MKKYITLLSFIVCFIASAQFANAQSNSSSSPEAIAKKKTHEMHQLVELNGEQQKSVFYLLVDAENNIAVIDNSGADVNSMQARKSEIFKYVNTKLKSILTQEQYKTYIASLDTSMNKSASSKVKKQ